MNVIAMLKTCGNHFSHSISAKKLAEGNSKRPRPSSTCINTSHFYSGIKHCTLARMLEQKRPLNIYATEYGGFTEWRIVSNLVADTY